MGETSPSGLSFPICELSLRTPLCLDGVQKWPISGAFTAAQGTEGAETVQLVLQITRAGMKFSPPSPTSQD